MNMAIYRAKKIDSDEYVIGYYFKDSKCSVILTHSKTDYTDDGMYMKAIIIDPTTLSISFSDMLDSQGNKIFASLSESGKGGDICEFESVWSSKVNAKGLCIYFDREIILKIINRDELNIMAPYSLSSWSGNFKIIGIQK